MNSITALLSKNRLLFLISAGAFLLGVPSGILAYPLVKDRMSSLVNSVFAGILEGSDAQIIFNVFLRNIGASLMMLFVGITIVLTLAILWLNGFFVGLVSYYAFDKGVGLGKIILGVLPHSIFELPAIFLSAAIGIRCGVELIKPVGRIRRFSQAIREASVVFLLVVVPLLVVSAFVEVLVSKKLI